jgi:signal transduction histidine kinase/ActR/RegA family two-component response regulator
MRDDHRTKEQLIGELTELRQQVAEMQRRSQGLDTVKERERLLAQIREQARQMQQIIDTVPEGVLVLGAENRVLLANPAGRRDLEVLSGTGVGDRLVSLGGQPLPELLARSREGEWHTIRADGYVFELIARPTQAACGDVKTVLVIRDMTREREMQRRMWQQDRMAAIGQLAGGVAHDFNNLLTVIKGFVSFALEELAPGDPVREDLQQVTEAADRASSLTNQLLIFSRQQVLQPGVLDLNAVILGVEKMLRRLIGEDVKLDTALDPSLGQVKADRGQIEQVIMNLAVNARDAMPQGGQLILETENVVLDDAYVRDHPGAEPGVYVMLAVSDSGVGMSEQVKAHIFEPFFTTKKAGKGTGLGLATVWGIVKRSGGHVEVYSELGIGTTFKVYLPRIEEKAQVDDRQQTENASWHGTEAILLVEDEESVRKLACRTLKERGYTVLTASHPDKALALGARHPDPIRLLVTDVVMPGMGGRDLAERMTQSHPEMKVLYVSGYTDDAIARHGVLDPDAAFLPKPFTLAALAHKVRQVLDER